MVMGLPDAQYARPGDELASDALLEPEHAPVPAAVVAHGGHAGLQGEARLLHALQYVHFVGLQANIVDGCAVAGHVGVGMAIDEAGDKGGFGEVVGLYGCAFSDGYLGLGNDVGDAAALGDDGHALQGRAALAIGEVACLDYDVRWSFRGHDSSLRSSG